MSTGRAPRARRGEAREPGVPKAPTGDPGPVQTLRIVPHLRSSVVEEMPPDQVLLFTSELDDSDVALLTGNPGIRPFTWPGLRKARPYQHRAMPHVTWRLIASHSQRG